MKILVVNSNTSKAVTGIIKKNVERYVSTETEVICMTVANGPSTIEGHLDALLAAKATAELIAEEEENFDGFLIACGFDPGLNAIREISSKPVLGISLAAMTCASMICHRFAVLTPQMRMVNVIKDMIHVYGMDEKSAGVYAVECTVADVATDQNKMVGEFIRQARQAVKDGADAICLGGATLSGMDKIIEAQVKVPVLDGIACGAVMLEALIRLHLAHSKEGDFGLPEKKQLIGEKQTLQRIYDRREN